VHDNPADASPKHNDRGPQDRNESYNSWGLLMGPMLGTDLSH